MPAPSVQPKRDLAPFDDVALDEQPRTRPVYVDSPLLTAARDAVAESGAAPMRLNLFDDLDLDVVFERTAQTRFGYSLSGRIEGDPLGSVTLVVNGDLVAAAVHSRAGAFVIGSRNGVVHTVEEMVDDLPIWVDEAIVAPELPREIGASVITAPDTDDGSELDLLVLFTRAALRAEGGLRPMRASVDFAVAHANDAFRMSGVDFRMRLVAAVPVDYQELEDPDRGGLHRQAVDLTRLRDAADEHLAEAHELRNRYAADIVHLVVSQEGGGASASSLRTDTADPSAWAFGVSNSLRSGWALLHAIGRHLGVRSDRYVSGRPASDYPPYAHGYVNQRAFEPDATEESRWRTIMSSYGQCNDQGFTCRWLPRYSNPNQKYPAEDGDPLGVPGDFATDAVDGPANAVRRLNETRGLIAGYRQSAGRCDYGLSETHVELPWTGGTFSFEADTTSDCRWTAWSLDGFLSIASDADGAGAGHVTYRVEPNVGPARVGYVIVAGETLSVFQSGSRAPASVCERTPAVRDAIVTAVGKGCADVSEFDLLEVVDLDLRYRGIATLDGSDFSGLRYLSSLTLTGNPLRTVPSKAFADLFNLRDLSFRSTALTSIPTGFRSMQSLRILDLCCTAIESLHSRSFAGLSELRLLNLAGNRLTDLPDGLLSDQVALRYLYLSGNRLTDLRKETLEGPMGLGLSRVYLDGNPLGKLREDAFATIRRIWDLDLSDTQLEEIAPRTFAGLSLGYLNLADNRLEDLAGIVFPDKGVNSLTLRNNALRELPAGMFAGFSTSVGGRESLDVDLTGNPGTPFPIHLELLRIHADPEAPGAAEVVVRVREGAPWTMTVRVTATGGASFAKDVTVAMGDLQSEPFTVADNGIALLRLATEPEIPGSYLGLEIALGDPLRLFPLKDLDLKVRSTPFELDLAALFDATDPGTSFTVASSRPAVATVSVADGTLTVTPLGEGRTTVTVASRTPSGATTRHRFGVTVADRDGTLESANLMPVGTPLAGTLLDESDVDVYRLDLAGAATVEVRTSGPTDTRGLLLDSSGTIVASDEGSGPGGHNFRIVRGLAPGIYYVAVSGAAGDYAVGARLTDALDQGGTEASAALLTLYTREQLRRVSPSILLGTAGRISSAAADVDVFRLDVHLDDTDFTVRSSGGTALHARLLDSSLTQLAADDRGGNLRIDAQLGAGIYYLSIGGHETGNYRVLASGDSASCPGEMAMSVRDIGGSPESSVLLPVGGAPRAGSMGNGADADVFRLDLSGSATVEVRTSGPTDTRGELLRADGATIAADDDGGPGGHNFRIVENLPAGIYYVAVSGAAGGYAVTARLATTLDQGGTAAASTLLPLFTERALAPVSPRILLGTAGRIWPTAADVDVFRLDVPRDGTRVTLRSSGGTALRGRLVEPSLTEVAADRVGDNIRIDAELDAGIYYLMVTGHTTGNYRVLASTDSAEACPR